MDPKAVAPQDRIADDGRREITELQTEHERQWKSDSAPATVDTALDDSGGPVALMRKEAWNFFLNDAAKGRPEQLLNLGW